MKLHLPILVTLLLAQFSTAVSNWETRCFTTSGKKPIRVEWGTSFDSYTGLSYGFVRYAGQKDAIPLIHSRQVATEKPDGRPWEFETTWSEVVDTVITGRYVMVSQGAVVSSFVYQNLQNGKTFHFSPHLAAEESGQGCNWAAER